MKCSTRHQAACSARPAPQATHTGFAYVNQENVFRVCDQPHPLIVDQIVRQCSEGRLEEAYEGMRGLCNMGFSPQVCCSAVLRVCCSAVLRVCCWR